MLTPADSATEKIVARFDRSASGGPDRRLRVLTIRDPFSKRFAKFILPAAILFVKVVYDGKAL